MGHREGDYMFPAMKFFRVSAYESLNNGKVSIVSPPSVHGGLQAKRTYIYTVHTNRQTDIRLFHIPLGLFSEIYNKIKGYGEKQNTIKLILYTCM